MVHVVRARANLPIGALLTTVNAPAQRVAMHAVRVDLLQAQADALGVPLWQLPIPSPCTNEEYEHAMEGAVRRAVADGSARRIRGSFLEDIGDREDGWRAAG